MTLAQSNACEVGEGQCRAGKTVETREIWAGESTRSDDGSAGAQGLWYEGRNPVEMTEHTPPMLFLIPSFTLAWALWVLEGLCPLALMGFSEEQPYVSTHLLVLMALS